MSPYQIGLNLASRCRMLPRLVRRHPLAVISAIGLCMFLSVFTLADTRDRNNSLLYAPIDVKDAKGPGVADTSSEVNKGESNLTVQTKPYVSDDDSGYFRLDQAARRKRIHDVCSEIRPYYGMVNTLISSHFNLTYCTIPRFALERIYDNDKRIVELDLLKYSCHSRSKRRCFIGSANTFWLQIFRYINRDFLDSNPRSPLDLSPEEAHNRPLIRTRPLTWKLLKDDEKIRLLKTKIFMSVQDPYMRLWSTYVHALILPELWHTIGQKIEATRPRQPPQPIAFFQPRRRVRCGHDVTFAEFINYTLDSYEKDFAPYYRQCDPCLLRPHYVIKAETWYRDNVFVLEHMQLAWAVRDDDVIRKFVTQYVTSVVSSSFNKMKNAPPTECNMTITDVAHRLWKAFEVEGIIPEGSHPPSLDGTNQSQFIHLVLDKATREQQEKRMQQKRKFMTIAFRNLQPETLKKIQEKYDMDFRLFNYDPHPSDIFMI